ncbi:MAG: hypothetical protein A2Y91_04740 [Chloroflexi bacterium RBG_13_54_8]|nr:MAG: hypothetical protein A2Y91_04740 [Chloroflexi bacterium RBG_13_54_8]
MADVRPFCGLRYNVARIGDISSVVSPPYDIVSTEDQRFYYRESPHNAIRLELGEEYHADSAGSNKYTRAADTLRDWLEQGILFREPVPAFYICQHRFVQQGVLKNRWDIAGRVRLEGRGTAGARPHETTMESRVQDRLGLLHACRVNVSPILGIVRPDEQGVGLASLLQRFVEVDPDLSAVDRQRVIHNMWVIRDEQSIAQISAWCADKVVYIADGHHRYETALAYQKDRQAALSTSTGDEGYNFAMITMAGADDPGTIALPTHRLLRLPKPKKLVELAERLSRFFDMDYLDPVGNSLSETLKGWLDVLEGRGRKGIVIGAYGLEKKRLCLLSPWEKARLDGIMPRERTQEWKSLDVSVLQSVILRQVIGVDTSEKEEERLAYTQDEQEAVSRVDSGEYQLAFLVNPLPISSILAVADAGDRMPPKSTYFYPKLPTGLVMYPLWDNET